jgi:hypothetical protein
MSRFAPFAIFIEGGSHSRIRLNQWHDVFFGKALKWVRNRLQLLAVNIGGGICESFQLG